jgi:hypothetical protein
MILMRQKLTGAAVALLAASALVTSPGAAHAAQGTKASFAVSTQFSPEPSVIVAATGPFTACTTVTDLGGDAVDTGPNTVLFTGQKRLNCDGGTVVLSYEARLNSQQVARRSGPGRSLSQPCQESRPAVVVSRVTAPDVKSSPAVEAASSTSSPATFRDS